MTIGAGSVHALRTIIELSSFRSSPFVIEIISPTGIISVAVLYLASSPFFNTLPKSLSAYPICAYLRPGTVQIAVAPVIRGFGVAGTNLVSGLQFSSAEMFVADIYLRLIGVRCSRCQEQRSDTG
jgi:hypothetical protein